MRAKKILYFQYTDPAIGYPPLEHSSELLANKGWQVLFLGITFQSNIFSLKSHKNIKVKKLKFVKAGWCQKINFIWFIIRVIYWVWRWRPDWIYASNPTAAPAAFVLTLFYRDRVVYHEHDSPDTKDPTATLFMRFIYWARLRAARGVKICVLPNHERVKIFEKDTGVEGKSICVWNCPLLDEIKTSVSTQRKSILVLYHGSLVPQRLPMSVFEACAKVGPEVMLRVTGYASPGCLDYLNELQELANRLGISKQVEFSSAETREKLLASCRECDVGLTYIPADDPDLNMRHMLGASNKPFDYLACGLALLVSGNADWKGMYVDAGYGLICDMTSVNSIAVALEWFILHPKEMHEMGERGREKILSEWNYEKEFAPVLKELERIDG